DVVAFRVSVVELALRPPDAPEVEPHRGYARGGQRLEQHADDDRPHVAAELRMRVGEYSTGPAVLGHDQLAFERQPVSGRERHRFDSHALRRYRRFVAGEGLKQPIKMLNDRVLVK